MIYEIISYRGACVLDRWSGDRLRYCQEISIDQAFIRAESHHSATSYRSNAEILVWATNNKCQWLMPRVTGLDLIMECDTVRETQPQQAASDVYII